MYGRCGTLSCPLRNDSACWDMVEKDYFFYVAFENSICKDYITEKFFAPMLRTIVPIVLGGDVTGSNDTNDYISGLGAPINSYIDAARYQHPGQLAKYLNTLILSPKLYSEYLWWKEYYKVLLPDFLSDSSKEYCEMCERLHKESTRIPKNHKVIHDLVHFWMKKSVCSVLDNNLRLTPETYL